MPSGKDSPPSKNSRELFGPQLPVFSRINQLSTLTSGISKPIIRESLIALLRGHYKLISEVQFSKLVKCAVTHPYNLGRAMEPKAAENVDAASLYARNLIEASLDPLVTISPEGKITDVNEATIKVTGVSREKLIGTDFSNYFIEPQKAREGYKLVFSQGTVTDYPLTIRHRNGKLTDVLYNASVYKDVAGNVLGVFAAARDITAQRMAEAQVAEQRTKELERLIELERFQKLTVGRELKMIELKLEIEELKMKLGERP